MQKPVEKVWDLTIAPDTVRLIIERPARSAPPSTRITEDGAEHEIELDDDAHDTHHHDGLAEEETEDQTAQELRQIIRELNVDEAAELIALTGSAARLDEPAEFAEAVAEAEAAQLSPTRYPARHADARRLAGRRAGGDRRLSGKRTGTPAVRAFNGATTCERNR